MPDGWEVAHGLNPLDPSDALEDPDHDMLPNVYEYFYGTDPFVADSQLVPKLRVDPAGALTNAALYASINAAFRAATNYSIIEIAPGTYTGANNTGLWFPAHPVLVMSDNWGTSRTTVIEYTGVLAAFYLNALQDNRTIVRGLTLRLSGRTAYQIGFWLGDGAFISSNGAAPFFDGVTLELGESDVNIGYFCRSTAPKPIVFNNCILRGQCGKFYPMLGVYAVDSPAMRFFNCTFQNFATQPYSYGVQFESTRGNNGSAGNPVNAGFVNCVWDESFANPNVEAFVRLQNGVVYNIGVTNCIMAKTPSWFPPDSQSNLFIANAYLSMGGHQLPTSPGVDAGAPALTWYDFEGQPRDAMPDIGADEYAGFGTGDTDGDGISDADEVLLYRTDMYNADTDGDGISDGAEVARGTSPTNPANYSVTVLGTVTNLTGSPAPVHASYSFDEHVWNSAIATTVDQNGAFTLTVVADQEMRSAWVHVFCDFNTNGLVDASEPVYSSVVVVTGEVQHMSFTLRDFDGDGVADWDEVVSGSDPTNPASYQVTIQGAVTNQTAFTGGNFRVICSLSSNGCNALAATNVTGDGTFLLPNVTIHSNGPLWVVLFDDANTNAALDADEAYIPKILAVTGAVSQISIPVSLATCDKDGDGMLDFWEHRHGLSWTNAADALQDPDSDGLINLYEYWAQTDPRAANTNYALADAALAVDTKIAGLNPTNALPIFANYMSNGVNGVFIRNTNCWAASYDLTCCSPWNSYAANKMAGTLISPRHVLFAAHYDQLTTGSVIRFVDSQNNVVDRVLVAKKQHPHWVIDSYPDFTVGLIDSDVPTNQITFARVLPDNYSAYIRNGIHLPAVRLDQKKKVLIGDVQSVAVVLGTHTFATFDSPTDSTRAQYYEDIIGGDSGNPAFLLLRGRPILLTVWTSGGTGQGTSVTALKTDINQLMTDLGGGYRLTEINLSGFTQLDN